MRHDQLPIHLQRAHEEVADLMAQALFVLTAANDGDQELAALYLATTAKDLWTKLRSNSSTRSNSQSTASGR